MSGTQGNAQGTSVCVYDRMENVCMVVLVSVQMLMDPMGGIVMTNDGNAILREVSS